MERVDSSPSYGEVPGSPAYGKRECDAVPDEVVILSGPNSRRQSTSGNSDRASSPSGGTTPRTVVEKVDPESPSYGDVPGTPAYDLRKADTPPDLVRKVSESQNGTPKVEPNEHENGTAGNGPVPETLLSRVDSLPSRQASRASSHRRNPSDALPDGVERIDDSAGKPACSY